MERRSSSSIALSTDIWMGSGMALAFEAREGWEYILYLLSFLRCLRGSSNELQLPPIMNNIVCTFKETSIAAAINRIDRACHMSHPASRS